MNECCLEFDKSWEEYIKIIQDLKRKNLEFFAYATKSHRAQHIHIFFTGDLALMPTHIREKKRLSLIQLYGCDQQLKGDKHMVALEYCEHWKTGEMKELIARGK